MGTAMSRNFNQLVHDAAVAPWNLAVEPFKVAPRIYYVGNVWVGAYLIDTEEGLILLDASVFETAYQLIDSIYQLGFNPHNIKHIMVSHFHFDHNGAAKALRELTGAKVWMSKTDADLRTHPSNLAIARGKDDPYSLANAMDHEVDCYYEEGKVMQFGSVTIQPILTPGHTPGAISFIITMPDENGKTLVAAMHGGVGPITMTDETYEELGVPNLRPRFIADCDELKKIHVDIAIPSHPSHGNLMERRGDDPKDYHKLVDETEWPKFLEERKQFIIKFDAEQKEKHKA